MLFRTELVVKPFPVQLSLDSRILSVGSCFAEVIGNQLKTNKFKVIINPFGTIFNPVSLTSLLETSLTSKKVTASRMIESLGIWYHYDLHSSISASGQDKLIGMIEEKMEQTAHFIAQADWIFITMGTAFVYQFQDSGEIVANCHKMPSRLFTKRLLEIHEITEAVHALYNQLIKLRPQVRLLLTVSPVRHIKDGILENQVSKSILRLACHQLTQQFDHIYYFPSYELMMDDLREYRFYKQDLIHPSGMAEEYIWDKFVHALVDIPTQAFIKEWQTIRQALAHQPFHPETATHQQFLRQTLAKLKALANKVDLQQEIALVEKRIYE
ncbi:GSCFA domain-containing protein [Rhodocytophaga rosea]|uniref:GSCFA domain-containing protein n=1 Tax=Rhodocytophaga rosea TaxID=2704465 RepID=A0A6C0GN43_9BACT|nr:GSCFA domain-containing protein [Rhodocytophaga rosea]QHT69264.1 GSCFA domain-containing protein [Rhodocytophaga rosea]